MPLSDLTRSVATWLKGRIPVNRRRKITAARISLRRHSAAWRSLPGLLIVGAQRCGTSSLYKYLGDHPQVIPALRKETEYFSTSFFEGEFWYRAHFPLRARGRILQGASGRPVIPFEATPDYLLDPRAAVRAADLLPEARIIAVLRNPTDRAFSQYLHNRRLGHEPLSFDEALDREPERLAGEFERLMDDDGYPARSLRRYSYVTRGKYADQISRWWNAYPSDKILILQFEELVASPGATLRRIENFLDIEEWVPNRFVNYSYGHGMSRPSLRIPESTRRRLDAVFEPHNAKLAEMLEQPLQWLDRTDTGTG